jgi:hypothetical protein
MTNFDTEQAATYLGISESTLNKWHVAGDGPAFYKMGHRVVYTREHLDTYREKCLRLSTSQKGAAA